MTHNRVKLTIKKNNKYMINTTKLKTLKKNNTKKTRFSQKYNLKIIKLPSLLTTEINVSNNFNNVKKKLNLLKLLDFTNYFKFNKYQFIFSKQHFKRVIYNKPLITITNNKINDIIHKYNNINNNTIYIDLKKNNNNYIINRIIKLSLDNDILFKILPHDLTVIYCILLEKKSNVNKINIIQSLNNLISSINRTLYIYNNLTKEHNPSKDYNEIVEHLIFNASFDYIKQFPELFNKINPKYKNQFNEKKEILITNNKYIQLYYPKLPSTGSPNELMFSNVGLYSISKPYATKQILDIIKNKLIKLNLLPSKLILTDATAGLGGDTIAFAKEFNYVNSIEIQPIHHKIIKNNTKLFNLNNINHINGDYTKIYDKIKQDIVFIDSPWGGTEYTGLKIAEMRLFGSSLTFNKFIKVLLKKSVIIFLKTPINFDLKGLKKLINKDAKIINDNVNNFLLISIIPN
jgi:hypothetical protein